MRDGVAGLGVVVGLVWRVLGVEKGTGWLGRAWGVVRGTGRRSDGGLVSSCPFLGFFSPWLLVVTSDTLGDRIPPVLVLANVCRSNSPKINLVVIHTPLHLIN